MAFQPIFDLSTGSIFAQEALVRGPAFEPPSEVFAEVTEENRYNFDQLCRTRAIECAAELGLDGALSINFLPNAVYEPAHCIRRTLWAADKADFPPENLIFEFTEGEQIRSTDHLLAIVSEYRRHGFRIAIDDFGAGFAGLGLLADLQPDILKLDMHLIRGIESSPARRSIVRATLRICSDLGILAVAEGIETPEELDEVADLGVHLVQGYLIARPSTGRLVQAHEISAGITEMMRLIG
ncbi:EAL domain-containing protein [Paroceanicella profunda]|uniref:EAL domain-containing protein n=1 Tax=Paroceanicella profunda TaxID=2579971 RepID=A0A5B8FIP9_9RHOB|nr:EAL domain-containing protein [Paroceanicella profunda]QDL93487.1 EAL domain-containing protein [Paroceanicella profunda]